jgi:redox-sensitive bicupin YhaK (pirin superfamily)
MSNIDLIIEERAASIGSFMVGRLLPFRQKRAVGPFVFLDHMGPAQLDVNTHFDVLPHPHIGLSTLTYLFEGEIMHRDSIGSVQRITPGAVNWMTAGSGVVHSERTPDELRNETHYLHGLQIWVALPKELEETAPSFMHIEANALPTWKIQGAKFKLIAGEAFGKKSPVPVYSPLYFIEITSEEGVALELGDQIYGESALYIHKGSVFEGEHEHQPGRILVAKETKMCSLKLASGTKVFLFGGEPFPEERFIWWNFVSSEKALIDAAKTKWKQQQFPRISGETEFVPLP